MNHSPGAKLVLQNFSIRRVVIDDQNAQLVQTNERRRHNGWGGLFFEPGGKPESRAFSFHALHTDLPTHHLDQLFRNRETQTSSAILTRVCAVGLSKRLELFALV